MGLNFFYYNCMLLSDLVPKTLFSNISAENKLFCSIFFTVSPVLF